MWGSLPISKTLTGDQATDDDIAKAFSFTITLKNKNGNSLRGTYSYTGSGIEDGTLTPDTKRICDSPSLSTARVLPSGNSPTVSLMRCRRQMAKVTPLWLMVIPMPIALQKVRFKKIRLQRPNLPISNKVSSSL